MTSLNPLLNVGRQISEAVALHQGLSHRAALDRAVEMLRRVHIPEPEQRVQAFPHQLSGGMRQRVMIAMALSCNPKVLIADEPTTALDVTIQAQILDLMRELRDTLGTAIILITHDMGVVAENADRVVVMYAGRKVEEAPVDDLFERPAHPYTRGLLGSDSEPRPHRARAARTQSVERDQGYGSFAVQLAEGLQFRAALRAGDRTLSRECPQSWSCTGQDIGSHAGAPERCCEQLRRCWRSRLSRSISRSTKGCFRACPVRYTR